MPYTVHIATRPDLDGDFDPRHQPYLGEARTIKAALKIAKDHWKPGWAFTIRDRNNLAVRTLWENGK